MPDRNIFDHLAEIENLKIQSGQVCFSILLCKEFVFHIYPYLLKYFLKNRLSVTFKVNDLFDTGKFIIDTSTEVTNTATQETYTQLMYAERQRQKRNTSIVLNYNFGKQQKKKWSRGSFSGRSGGMGGGGMDMDY